MKLFVLGMHRSGTSLATELLTASGLFSGDCGDFHAANDQDPNGYWEHKDFFNINEFLLKECGGSWDRPDQYGAKELDQVAKIEAETLALEAIAKLNSCPCWVVKDPRFSLTLPFWRELIPDLCVLVMHRNPAEVAQSLRNRNGFPLEYGIAIWDYYARAIHENTKGLRTTLLNYQHLLTEPEQTLTDLIQCFREWECNCLSDTDLSKSIEIVDRKLYRAKAKNTTASDVMSDQQQELASLFDQPNFNDVAIDGLPERTTASLIDGFGALIHENNQKLNVLNEILAQRDVELANGSKHSQSLEKDLEKKDKAISALSQAIEKNDRNSKEASDYVTSLNQNVKKAEAYSLSLKQTLLHSQENSRALEKKVGDLEQQIVEISQYAESSKSHSDKATTYSKSLESLLAAKEKEILSQTNYITSLKHELQQVVDRNKSLEDDYKTQNNSINEASESFKDKLSEVDEYVRSLKAEIDKTTRYAKTLEQEIEKSSAYIKSLEAQLEKNRK